MKPSPRSLDPVADRAMALVVTLIMLSVVTLMAVVFLAISRREKASVTVTSDLTEARLMADAAVARAQAEVISRMVASTNLLDYDFLVSTNLINPTGFHSESNNIYNVSYNYPDGRPLTGGDYLQNLANLWFDPRPPVVVPVSVLSPAAERGGRVTNDFRFYLDFNRNGRYDPTGYRIERAGRGLATNYYVGDPEWIGVLTHPDLPHGESNYFRGRFAYIVVPTGKALDLNYIHNSAKYYSNLALGNGFLRNEGIGSWEINLAGFLDGLNTNYWGTYGYTANAPAPSRGLAFDDAQSLLRYRYTAGALDSMAAALGPLASLTVGTSGVDAYADGPLERQPGLPIQGFTRPDPVTRGWPGSENPQGYYDHQELFDPAKTANGFVARLLSASQGVNPATRAPNPSDAYDGYTFYRLMAQLGLDSQPADTVRMLKPNFQTAYVRRLNLNYAGELGGAGTNLVKWTLNSYYRTNFFIEAADRLLRASLTLQLTNLTAKGRLSTNFALADLPVRNDISVTNIQIYHAPTTAALPFYVTNNEYSATTHRLLQLAANILDATASRNLASRTPIDFPTVLRPVFYKTPTNLIISGYVEENTTNFLQYPMFRADQLFAVAGVGPIPRVMVYGVPVIIGAKKGFPNFNEFSMDTTVIVSRKLQIRKAGINAPPPWQTNQMYVIGITNVLGFEGWNSYQTDFRHPFELRMRDFYTMGIYDTNYLGPAVPLFTRAGLAQRVIDDTVWTNRNNPASFRVFTNVVQFLPDSAYLPGTRAPYFFAPGSNAFQRSFFIPGWVYRVTNEIQYALVDKSMSPPRVVDFVNLEPIITAIDISSLLVGQQNAVGNQLAGGSTGGALAPGDFWNPQRVGGGNRQNAPTIGITNQIGASLGNPVTGGGEWRSWSGNVVSGQDKDRAIDAFRVFMGLRRLTPSTLPAPTYVMDAPFTPTRILQQTVSYQANDPLVHYTLADLADPALSDSRNLLTKPNLGKLNLRYRPWGGYPFSSAPEATAMDFRFKDPGIRESDDWQFPTNTFASIGWLGRVHRGTPWQTMYLKAAPGIDLQHLRQWVNWSGSLGTYPTNDWKLLDLFTTAPSQTAARGLLSVNQTNLAAWSAVLSGVPVLTNVAPDSALSARSLPRFDPLYVEPPSVGPQVSQIVQSLIQTRAAQPGGTFQHMGDVLATPALTVQSPYLNWKSQAQMNYGLTDEVLERIPQEIMSLLKPDQPRVTIYAFGQALRPAEHSVVTSGQFYNLCTNYQVTAEAVSKTVLRFEPVPNATNQWRSVVESYNVLPIQ